MLAVEVKQYPGQFGQAIVSRVIGQTASSGNFGAGAERSRRGRRHRMSVDEFLEGFTSDVRTAAEKLIRDAHEAGGIIRGSPSSIRIGARCSRTITKASSPSVSRANPKSQNCRRFCWIGSRSSSRTTSRESTRPQTGRPVGPSGFLQWLNTSTYCLPGCAMLWPGWPLCKDSYNHPRRRRYRNIRQPGGRPR